jgi:hypothetical protein
MSIAIDNPPVAYQMEASADQASEAYTMGECDDYRIQSASSFRPDDFQERLRNQRAVRDFAELVGRWSCYMLSRPSWGAGDQPADVSAATLRLIRHLEGSVDEVLEDGIVALRHRHKVLFTGSVDLVGLKKLQPRISDYDEFADQNDE